MLWLLLLQQTYLAEASGSARVRVKCAGCGAAFRYRLRRTAVVEIRDFGSVSDRRMDDADRQAEALLDDLLARDIDPVPCPRCGDYQPDMAALLKRRRYRRLLRYQTPLACAGVTAGLWAVFFTAVTAANAHHQTASNIAFGTVLAAGGWVVAVATLGLRAWNRRAHAARTATYDPNDPADRDARLALAARRAQPLGPGQE